MFKVRTVPLGRVLTFSTAALYLGYLWYKRKRTLSHRQSDKKRSSSEPSELNKIEIDDQELLLALEKASRDLEVSRVVEEEPAESLVNHCEEIMEPTINEFREVVSFIVNESDTNDNSKSSNQEVCFEPKIITNSLAENLNNMKLNPALDQDNVKVVDNSINIEQVKEYIDKEVKYPNEKGCWTTEMVENEGHCECPKSVNVRKLKKDEEPMLFEGIKFKGKKKRNRNKNQARDTIIKQLPTEMHDKNKNIKSAKKIIPVVEEDCDSAHSIDHSIDTNDTPNTICSDIRSEVSIIFYLYLYFKIMYFY